MSKRIAIMQPYIFPYIGYFQLANYVKKFVFYDDVTFIKQGWINRNKITVNSQEIFFTVPLSKVSSYKRIHEVEINKNIFKKIKKKLYKSIEQAYGKSPYFKEVNEIIKSTFELDTNNINEMAQHSVKSISKYLELKTEFFNSKNAYQNDSLSGQDRVIDIVLKEKANHYVNPIGGRTLYDSETFKQRGINLSFIKVDDNLKNQLIIDILMNFNKEEVKKILNQYSIVK